MHTLTNLGTAEATAGDAVAGRRMLLESLERARAAGFEEHAARAYTNTASLAATQFRLDEATAALDAGLEYCGERDLDAWTLYLRGWQAQLHLDRGDQQAAQAAALATLRRPELRRSVGSCRSPCWPAPRAAGTATTGPTARGSRRARRPHR